MPDLPPCYPRTSGRLRGPSWEWDAEPRGEGRRVRAGRESIAPLSPPSRVSAHLQSSTSGCQRAVRDAWERAAQSPCGGTFPAFLSFFNGAYRDRLSFLLIAVLLFGRYRCHGTGAGP